MTDLLRDHVFTIAWFGLMTMVWLGWAQEDPPPSWRGWLGAGSMVGVALAGVFGYAVVRHWDRPSALEGRYEWFGVLTGVELLLAAAGAILLWRRGQARWMAWWVALVVALHFLPLALLLEDASLAVLGLVQAVALALLVPRLRREKHPTSRLAGPVMGITLLLFATVSVVGFVARHGAPW